jgi:hypothetical protein
MMIIDTQRDGWMLLLSSRARDFSWKAQPTLVIGDVTHNLKLSSVIRIKYSKFMRDREAMNGEIT